MVGGEQHQRTVEAIHDEGCQLCQFIQRLGHRIEGFAFRALLVAQEVDLVVIDIDHPLVTDVLAALVLAQCQQIIGLDGDALDTGQLVAALLDGGDGLAVGHHVQVGILLVGQ